VNCSEIAELLKNSPGLPNMFQETSVMMGQNSCQFGQYLQ